MNVSLGAALLAGALAAGTVPALARHAVLLGPRSLYPATNRLRSSSEIPLVIRDAIESIANRTRLLAVGPRIMGGEPAPPGVFPWMASLELKLRRKDAHFCGGAFIAPQWVLTAAHCVKPDSAGAIDALGGTNTLDTGGALYAVDRVIVHEKYSTDTQDYDVALLHLSKAFPGKTVRLLSAADAERYAPVGGYAISAGWGLTAEGTDVSNVLRQVTVQIVSNKTCNGLAAYAGAVTDHMLCAGFPGGGKDSCQGDSGGPLMVSDGQGGYFQAGIVSWGEGCGRPNKFGVYTRVSTIADWVAEKTGERAAPTASNAAPTASRAATKSAEAVSADTRSTRSEQFANASPMSRLLQQPPKAPLQEMSPSQPTLLLPLPRPPPPALLQERKALPRLRTERRLGVPMDRKYGPSYPTRAQMRQSRAVQSAPTRVVPRNRPRRYYYYMSPANRGVVIPPSFDWRLFR